MAELTKDYDRLSSGAVLIPAEDRAAAEDVCPALRINTALPVNSQIKEKFPTGILAETMKLLKMCTQSYPGTWSLFGLLKLKMMVTSKNFLADRL